MLHKGKQSSPGNHGHSNTPNSWQIPPKRKTDSAGRQCPLIHKHDRPISGSPRCPASDRIAIFLIVGPDTSIQSSLWNICNWQNKKILSLSRLESISSQMSPRFHGGWRTQTSSCLCSNWKGYFTVFKMARAAGGLGGWALNAGVARR